MDIGLLIVRLAVGLTLAAHGSQKLFGAFGGHGIAGTTKFVESLGFRPARMHAYLLGSAEVVGGLLLAAGLLTPIGALMTIGVMTAAAVAVHWKNGFFVTEGGFEFTLVMAASAAAVAFIGPGAYSLDALFEIGAVSDAMAAGAVVVGVMSGVAVAGVRNLPERIRFHRAQPQR
jgi:putative oxidoreductase